ncbi:MAG TPA: hypothetical protein VMI54_12540 [Polyangiaceae bacterium]|nr:hypothetical protein [Polyangiaceae bacterium]
MNGSTRSLRSLGFLPSSALVLAVASLLACSSSDDHGAGSAGRSASGGATPLGSGGSAGGTSASGASNASATGGSPGHAGGADGAVAAGGTGGSAGSAGAPGVTPGSGGSTASAAGGVSGGASPGAGGSAPAAGTGGGNGAAGSSTSGGAGQPGAGGAAPTGTPTLFWLDVSGKVERSDVANFSAKTIVPSAGQGSDGIAVDVAAGYIYWTDMGVPADNDGSVMRSNLDGSNVTTLVPKGGTYTPKQLKLVPEQAKLYWSDREGMRVMRSNLDGSQVETIYQSGSTDADRMDDSRWCVGVAVDVAGGYFYWSQKGTDTGHEGSVRRAHLTLPDGDTPDKRSDVEVLFDGEAATCDIDLDLTAGFIYWANRGDNTINRGPIAMPSGATAQTRTDKQAIVPNVTQAIGVALDHDRGIAYYTDAVGDVGRANFDGSDSKFLLTNSGAFTGIVIVNLPN